jgi:hypothetical protein
MSLTAKQEAFCQAIADGMNQADAYRHAYDTSNMKDSSIHVNASKLLSDAKVTQRVTFLKQALESKALWTREMSVKALINAYKVAQDKKNAVGMTGPCVNFLHLSMSLSDAFVRCSEGICYQ